MDINNKLSDPHRHLLQAIICAPLEKEAYILYYATKVILKIKRDRK